MTPWRPVPGNELLEMDGAGRFRRIPTVRDPKTFELKPHPTKRILVDPAEASKLELEVARQLAEQVRQGEPVPDPDTAPPVVPNDVTKAVSAGPAAPVPSGRRRG